MLAEECPNSTCYGVPLVRPPKLGDKNPRKVRAVSRKRSSLMFVVPLQECVVCGNIYVYGEEATAALDLPSYAQTSNMSQAASAPKMDKGKGRIDSSSQVRGPIERSIMAPLTDSTVGCP